MAITHTDITLAGKKRKLRFDVNAISEALEHLGQGIDDVPTLPACRTLLWVGIKHGENRPKFTLEAAGELLHAHLEAGGDLAELATELFNAVVNAYPQRKAVEPPAGEGAEGNAQPRTEVAPAPCRRSAGGDGSRRPRRLRTAFSGSVPGSSAATPRGNSTTPWSGGVSTTWRARISTP